MLGMNVRFFFVAKPHRPHARTIGCLELSVEYPRDRADRRDHHNRPGLIAVWVAGDAARGCFEPDGWER